MPAVTRAGVLVLALSVLAAGLASANHAPTDAPARFTGGLEDERVDANGDGTLDALRLGVPVRVRDAGAYRVNVTLHWDDASSPVFTTVADLAPGDRVVGVLVPSDYMRNTGHAGTFRVSAILTRALDDAWLDEYGFTTQGYAPTSWPSPRARIAAEPAVVPRDADGDGHADALRVDVPVNVSVSGAYRVTACYRATADASANVTCRPAANVTLTRPGGLVTLDVPVTALPLNASAFKLDATVTLAGRDPDRVVDARTWTTPGFRAATFTRGTDPATNATVTPVTPGDALARGVQFSVDAFLARPEARELRVELVDPARGTRVPVAHTFSRPDAAGRVTFTLAFTADDATRVLEASTAPVAHWRVLDAFGLTIAGGRVDLPGKPVPAIVVESDADPIAGDAVTLVDASTSAWSAITTRAWRVDDAPAGDAERVTVTLDRRGASTVTLTVANAWGVTATATRAVPVAVNRAPVADLPAQWVMNEGEEGTLTLTGTDPEARALSWRLVDAPAGVTLTDATLAWTPDHDAQGPHDVHLALSDGYHDVPVTLRAVVWNTPAPPSNGSADAPAPDARVTITGLGGRALPADVAHAAGAPFELTVEAARGDGTLVPVTLVNRPEGATYADGVLSWDAPPAGVHVLRYRADDAEDVVVTLTVTEDAAGKVASASTTPAQGVAFVTPALAAGLAAGVGLVLRRRAAK